MFLNFNMQLIIEKKINKHYYNLFITSEITVFIADKCKKNSYRNIMFAFKKNNKLSINLKSIFHTHNVYIFLHYVLMFL